MIAEFLLEILRYFDVDLIARVWAAVTIVPHYSNIERVRFYSLTLKQNMHERLERMLP